MSVSKYAGLLSSWEFSNFRYGASLVLHKSSCWQPAYIDVAIIASPGWGSPEVPNDVAWRFDITSVLVLHQSILMMPQLTTSLTFDRNVMRHVWSEGASSTADQTRGP